MIANNSNEDDYQLQIPKRFGKQKMLSEATLVQKNTIRCMEVGVFNQGGAGREFVATHKS